MTISKENPIETVARWIICVVAFCFLGTLTVVSLLHTTHMGDNEMVAYGNDNVVLNAVYLIVGVILCLLSVPAMKKIPLWAETVFVAVWTVGLGVLWVMSSGSRPTFDSQYVTDAALAFANGGFSVLSDDVYFSDYSFQLGYVFFGEIIVRVATWFAPVKTAMIFEYLNVVLLAGSYVAILLINDWLFEDKRVRHLSAVLLGVSLAPVISCNFTYGIIPGLAFALWAMYFAVRWLKTDKTLWAIVSAVLMGCAVLLKSNYLIFYIALVILAVVTVFRKKNVISCLIFVVLASVMALLPSRAVVKLYEHRASVELGDSVPYVSWIAMGLSGTVEDYFGAPGWYNDTYTLTEFYNNGRNAEDTAAASKQIIRERIRDFWHDPQSAGEFAYYKFVSQWNETTYESIWNNTARDQYYDRFGVAKRICEDEWGKRLAVGYMDAYAQLIFFGTLLGVVVCMRKKDVLQTVFPLVVIGGMMYHMISEGKSQYAIPYVVLMMGFASVGMVAAGDWIARRVPKRLFCRRIKKH